MNKKNLPIAVVYCIFASLAFINLFFIIFLSFLYGNNYYRLSSFFVGISVFLYALFNCLFHWITHNTKPLKSLNKISIISDITIIYSFLLYYSFVFTNGPIKWVFFGINCLFFGINLLLFFIWTNIPFFISEIFKDLMYIPIIVFAFSIIPTLLVNTFILVIILLAIAMHILSIVFKYIFAATQKIGFYNTSKILCICVTIINIVIFYYFL